MNSQRGFARGRVQGVGFRYFVRGCAQRHGLCGYAINLADGRVEFLLQGDPESIENVVAQIRSGPRHARVDEVSVEPPCDLPARDGFMTR
jgi:acylphosphatase